MTRVTNQSGHYAPNEESIYYSVHWLYQRKCLPIDATVTIEPGKVISGDF